VALIAAREAELQAKRDGSAAAEAEAPPQRSSIGRQFSLKGMLGRLRESTRRLYTEKVVGVELPPIEVETSIVHEKATAFGFVIADTRAPPRVEDISDESVCPLVEAGDILAKINGVESHLMTGAQARELLMKTPVGWKAELVLRRSPAISVHSQAPEKQQQESTPLPKYVPTRKMRLQNGTR
jgi:hypothetical protein